LDFAEQFLEKDDFKKMKKSLNDEDKESLGDNYKDDIFVKAGGI